MILNSSLRSFAHPDAKQERNALFTGMIVALVAAAAVAVHALAVLGH